MGLLGTGHPSLRLSPPLLCAMGLFLFEEGTPEEPKVLHCPERTRWSAHLFYSGCCACAVGADTIRPMMISRLVLLSVL
eukprot:5558861-Amphidinium_carterae.1